MNVEFSKHTSIKEREQIIELLNNMKLNGKKAKSKTSQKQNKMTTIIFKSEKNAKVYEVRSAKNQGCYKENELIRVVRTDKIENLINDGQYQEIASEVK